MQWWTVYEHPHTHTSQCAVRSDCIAGFISLAPELPTWTEAEPVQQKRWFLADLDCTQPVHGVSPPIHSIF